jgi:DNA transformation protein and related proteins
MDDFFTYVQDQLRRLGPLRGRKMFGGVGIYHQDVFFALIAEGTLYFKVNDQTRLRYERAGCAPFKPFDDKPMTMKYYNVPEEVLDDVDEVGVWAREAYQVALASPKKAGKSKRP